MDMYTFYWDNGTLSRATGTDLFDAIKRLHKPWLEFLTSIHAFSKGDMIKYKREGGNWKHITA